MLFRFNLQIFLKFNIRVIVVFTIFNNNINKNISFIYRPVTKSIDVIILLYLSLCNINRVLKINYLTLSYLNDLLCKNTNNITP